jgi:uncharacterized protein YdeI (YjbR/CyaY-like superfamily)
MKPAAPVSKSVSAKRAPAKSLPAKSVGAKALRAKSFRATLEHSGNSLRWIIIRIPFDVHQTWGKRGQLRVQGEIARVDRKAAGFAFRTSLFPTSKGQHFMIVNKKMQAGAKVTPGMTAGLRMEPDTAPRTIAPPPELLRALNQDKSLRKYFDSLSHSMRRWVAEFVAEGKQAETRVRRGEQMAELFFEVMDAERELPPILRVALSRNAKASAGWAMMPPSHRRGHLFGIFHHRNPESRGRRLEKAMAEMVAYAEKRGRGSDE